METPSNKIGGIIIRSSQASIMPDLLIYDGFDTSSRNSLLLL